nr:DUF4333 domain-containing protein [Prauserella isguenensis]
MTACEQPAGDEESAAEPTSAVTTTESAEKDTAVTSPVPTPTETVRFFDVEKMNADVRNVVTEGYGLQPVREVSCPRNEPVQVGASFVCYIQLDAGERKVTITVETDQGRYRVGAPE